MISTLLDIETTNLLNGPDIGTPYDDVTGYLKDDREILEVAYIRADDKTMEILQYGTLYFYKPYFQVESEAQKIHGLTREFLQQFEKDFETNLIRLNSLIQQTCIVGKNSTGFDVPYIRGFIDKHSKGVLNMQNVVAWANQKTIDGQPIVYTPWLYQIDLQDKFKRTWRDLYANKYNMVVSGHRKGTLMEYIDVLELQGELDRLYNSLDKDRETGAHGALYDTVATYLVWKECRNRNIF